MQKPTRKDSSGENPGGVEKQVLFTKNNHSFHIIIHVSRKQLMFGRDALWVDHVIQVGK